MKNAHEMVMAVANRYQQKTVIVSSVVERECKHCDRPESEHLTMKALASPGHFFERYDRRQEER